MRIHKFYLFVFLLLSPMLLSAQGFLHTKDKQIVNAEGSNVLLRGIGTGNWMIQEGYMMLTGSALPTQHDYQNKLIELIGVARTDSFYNIWLDNHFSRTELDSMKAWGFNSVRPALHYLWFTPPIEEEPVAGEITWINRGFEMVDSLMKWCAENEMYLILDMHGVPGGQGKNASISDYDPEKPSLWESEKNKDKLVALWKKLADRYKNEPWMGGYDLINETNWDFEDSGNENGCNCQENEPLKVMFEDLIDAIREVDINHIIFLEGNCWANNYRGLKSLASYDDNVVYSFHKYWNYNNQESINWITHLRDSLNVPIWMGEGGENSNTWFANAVNILESNNIGWSWWPVKKTRVNNPFQVEINDSYLQLVEYFDGKRDKPSEEEIYDAIFSWAENHKAENCSIKYDVIDALIRQPFDNTTKPFKRLTTEMPINATDYDFGRNGHAYSDNDTGTYRTNTGHNTPWNRGMKYRNDGVDIELSNDKEAAGNIYTLFSIEAGEWLQYSVHVAGEGDYFLEVRMQADTVPVKFQLEVNNEIIGGPFTIEPDKNIAWKSYRFENIQLTKGLLPIHIKFLQGGGKLSYFKLINSEL